MGLKTEEVQDEELESGKDTYVTPAFTSFNTNIFFYFFFVLSVFIIFSLYCIPQIFIVYFGYSDSNSIKNTVISPFDSIVKEYSPKSSKPCSYPTLNYPYDTTSPCNFSFSELQHYCPINYSCEYSSQSSDSVFSCVSNELKCYNQCIDVILSLPILNGNETARIMDEAISSWSFYISLLSVILGIIITISLIGIICLPQIRNSKIAYIWIFMIWICSIFMGLGIIIGESIFIGTTPFHMYYPCYSGELSSTLSSISTIQDIFMLFFIFQCMFTFFLSFISLFHFVGTGPLKACEN